ncbi:MAG: hypothetical protein ACRDRG_12090 [Pseudonocardiaceae bacterium]
MDATEWTAIAAGAAWAGVVATAIIAVYTVVLARSARAALAESRKAREVAKDQAHHARESATAAKLAADAAVDSARSGRESVEITRATFDRDERPTVEATVDERQDDQFVVAVRMLTGPPQVTVTVRWAASSEGLNGSAPRRLDHRTGTSALHRLVLGDRIKLHVDVPLWADEATIRLHLDCTDVADGNRKWPITHVLEWARKTPQLWV